jgi:hypothetical protein
MDRDITAMSSVPEHCDIRAFCDIMQIPLASSLQKQNSEQTIFDPEPT